jgi:hypothetical protein
VTEKQEKQLVHALIADLSANFGLKLDPSPSLERGAESLDQIHNKRRTFFIGGSHMNKTVAICLRRSSTW